MVIEEGEGEREISWEGSSALAATRGLRKRYSKVGRIC